MNDVAHMQGTPPAPVRHAPKAPLHSAPGLEEVCVESATGIAAGLGFLLARAAPDPRLIAFVAPRFWFTERGRPYAHGLAGMGISSERMLVVTPRTETETLWTLEEVLRSGAAALAIGAVEGASLVATRRLDMIAREAGASAALIRTTPQKNLSAARRRWRLHPSPSAPNPWDARACGLPRWRAVLERSRDGLAQPGMGGQTLVEFDPEKDDETLRLHLVEGLADHGLAPGSRETGPAPRAGSRAA